MSDSFERSLAAFNVCTLRDVDSQGDAVVDATGFRPEVLDQALSRVHGLVSLEKLISMHVVSLHPGVRMRGRPMITLLQIGLQCRNIPAREE